jgi:hypothetical protein
LPEKTKGFTNRPSAAFPSSCTVQRTNEYASRLRISGALHLDIFEQPANEPFMNNRKLSPFSFIPQGLRALPPAILRSRPKHFADLSFEESAERSAANPEE